MLKMIENIRSEFSKKDDFSQEQLDDVFQEIKQYKDRLMPNENDEQLVLVNSLGNRTDLHAPRWMCHLLDIRHLCVHVLIRWKTPQFSQVFVFQIRSWKKFDSPGQIDISVGGHVTDAMETEKAALKEMEEEIGLLKNDLINSRIIHCTSYEKYDENVKNNFYNREWREVYVGDISTQSLESIKFNDNEVVGLYLCPQNELSQLLTQKTIPIASGLRSTLPYFIRCPTV